MECHQVGRDGPPLPGKKAPRVPGHQTCAADDVRLLRHLECAAAHLPEQVAAEEVVLLAVVEARRELAAARGSHLAMVMERTFRERARLPTLHPRGGDRDPVYAATAYRCVTANAFQARATKELALAVDMVFTDVAVGVRMEVAFDVMRPRDAERGHRFELVQQECHEVFTEGDVGIDISDH